MLRLNSCFISWILILIIFDVQFIHGLNVCQEDQIANVRVHTELQSEVLLPCLFESIEYYLYSNQTNTSFVVWSHLNSTNSEVVEIGLDGVDKFWDNRRGRIKTFTKLAKSELLNFSIQICNVQQSDLGVYHCKLFRETGCLLAYKRIELHNVDSLNWLIPTVAGIAAVLVMPLVLLVACKVVKCKKNNVLEPVYENTSQEKFANRAKLADKKGISLPNPIYSPISNSQVQ